MTNPFRVRTPEEESESRHSQDAATQSQRAGELAGDAFDSAIDGDVPEREPGEMNIERIV
jgi:HD-like signal output (HDOD) protein